MRAIRSSLTPHIPDVRCGAPQEHGHPLCGHPRRQEPADAGLRHRELQVGPLPDPGGHRRRSTRCVGVCVCPTKTLPWSCVCMHPKRTLHRMCALKTRPWMYASVQSKRTLHRSGCVGCRRKACDCACQHAVFTHSQRQRRCVRRAHTRPHAGMCCWCVTPAPPPHLTHTRQGRGGRGARRPCEHTRSHAVHARPCPSPLPTTPWQHTGARHPHLKRPGSHGDTAPALPAATAVPGMARLFLRRPNTQPSSQHSHLKEGLPSEGHTSGESTGITRVQRPGASAFEGL